jgi:hypothetical protein
MNLIISLLQNVQITDANRLAQKKMPFDEQEEKSQVQPFSFHSVKIASSNSCCLSCWN